MSERSSSIAWDAFIVVAVFVALIIILIKFLKGTQKQKIIE